MRQPAAKPVAGVGEDAVTTSGLQLIFRKGGYIAILSSGIDAETMKAFLGVNQLAALGKIVASRL
jgi:hypothetical protein